MTGGLAIGAVSEATGLSVHTLRFYEQEDLLLDGVRRDAGGRRVYTDRDVAWLRVCRTLRTTGMPVAEIRRYVVLAREGASTVTARQRLLETHADRVRAQLAELAQALGTIEQKVVTYSRQVEEQGPQGPDLALQRGAECAPPPPDPR